MVICTAPQFGKALADGWLQAGVLGVSRVYSVYVGDVGGQRFFNNICAFCGMVLYVDGSHGGSFYILTPEIFIIDVFGILTILGIFITLATTIPTPNNT